MSAAPIWSPSPSRAAASHLARFTERFAPSEAAASYAALHRWSIESPEQFWPALARYAGIRFAAEPEAILENATAMPGARWFRGATLNFAEALLENGCSGAALIFANERGDRETLSWDDLRKAVGRTAAWLASVGVGPGDRVAGILPNRPETVIAALATARLGAVWSSCSPDFGRAALLDRLGQVAPKVLLGTGAYYYNGKTIDCLGTLREVAGAIPSIRSCAVVPYAATSPSLAGLPDASLFDEMPAAAEPPPYAHLPFDAPLYIMFSSGTTGAPKCIVHSAGGTLLQHCKEHLLHTDISPGDRLFYFTTCGWMMWNWQISALASGATLVLYDGSPLHPDPGVLWRLAESAGVDIFGTSARYLAALEHSGYAPGRHHDLGRLRTVLSTGSPLPPSSFEYVARDIGSQIQVSSIAGGTDIISCFMLGNPMLPVYPGEIQCLGLGMDVHIFGEDGRDLQCGKGELVCTRPFPSMPIGFLNDTDGSAYRRAYFERFPGVWCHGDYAELTEHGGVVIHGRSDAVLNPGGVRIGTSEIYRVVDGLPEVEESVAVGQERGSDTRVILFVRLTGGTTLDAGLTDRIRAALREHCSPRHVPAEVLQVDAVPRTINGKLSELAVRETIHGRPVANRDALANPEVLEQYRNRPELEK